jgi:hypothetical protein
MLLHMDLPTAASAGQARARSQGRIWLPRSAALAVAAFFVVPLGYGIALVQSGIAGPPCVEYCDRPGGGRVWIAIAGLGLLMALGIWRRHLFLVAIALCLSVVGGLILLAFTAVIVVGLGVPLLGGAGLLVGLTAAVGLTGLLLSLVLLDAARLEAPTPVAPAVEET